MNSPNRIISVLSWFRLLEINNQHLRRGWLFSNSRDNYNEYIYLNTSTVTPCSPLVTLNLRTSSVIRISIVLQSYEYCISSSSVFNAADLPIKHLRLYRYHNIYKNHAYTLMFLDISTTFVHDHVSLFDYAQLHTPEFLLTFKPVSANIAAWWIISQAIGLFSFHFQFSQFRF